MTSQASNSYQRWKRAVVNLEGATHSKSFYDSHRLWVRLVEGLKSGAITEGEYFSAPRRPQFDKRFTGTALYVIHGVGKFLVTAQHVVHDNIEAESRVREATDRYSQHPQDIRDREIEAAKSRSYLSIFGCIFRIPNFDAALSRGPGHADAFLAGLGAGVPWASPYSFSDPSLDLAVISLNQSKRSMKFAVELEAEGYEAISSESFADEPSGEGAEVFTVGFPNVTSYVDDLRNWRLIQQFSASIVSLPTFAFDRVSMMHEKLDYFWADLSIYAGNSGGPVIESDRLVGIVSAQPMIPIEDYGAQGWTSVPFSRTIKSKHLLPLLDEQLEKDHRADIDCNHSQA